MKWSKTTKSILAISSATILALPALTLCGCSNISQYCIPVVTDSSPFYVGADGIKDPYRTTTKDKIWGYYDTPDSEETKTSASGYTIPIEYLQLPVGYLYTSKYNSNFSQAVSGMYGYCNYNKPSWQKDGPADVTGDKLDNAYRFSRKTDDDWAWRSLNDSNLQFISAGALSS